VHVGFALGSLDRQIRKRSFLVNELSMDIEPRVNCFGVDQSDLRFGQLGLELERKI
jgi:hypothetical protein